MQRNYDAWQLEAFATIHTASRSDRQRSDVAFAAIPACRESGSKLFNSVYENTKFLFAMFKGVGG